MIFVTIPPLSHSKTKAIRPSAAAAILVLPGRFLSSCQSSMIFQ
uniref:Uncharacterized protein n=1 Tax=Rhizophora mucronata TaxID=61149 RepID=A0A2P2JS35_RHIMU